MLCDSSSFLSLFAFLFAGQEYRSLPIDSVFMMLAETQKLTFEDIKFDIVRNCLFALAGPAVWRIMLDGSVTLYAGNSQPGKFQFQVQVQVYETNLSYTDNQSVVTVFDHKLLSYSPKSCFLSFIKPSSLPHSLTLCLSVCHFHLICVFSFIRLFLLDYMINYRLC
jgi:hypothetical protein